jgi:hypothetical protein
MKKFGQITGFVIGLALRFILFTGSVYVALSVLYYLGVL